MMSIGKAKFLEEPVNSFKLYDQESKNILDIASLDTKVTKGPTMRVYDIALTIRNVMEVDEELLNCKAREMIRAELEIKQTMLHEIARVIYGDVVSELFQLKIKMGKMFWGIEEQRDVIEHLEKITRMMDV